MSVLNNLSSYIQTELNTIAQDLSHEVVFYVTDSEQSYDDYITQMEYTVGNDIPYTPVLLKRLFATKQDDYVYGKYIETYRLDVFSREQDKNALEAIFDTFTTEQNTNDFDATDNVKKNHGKLSFVGLFNAKSGTNKHFISYTYEFTWDYIIGSIISDASSLTVDGTEIDFLGIAFQNDKILIPNVAYGSNTLDGTNGLTLAVTFPINSDTLGLFQEITSTIYNKKHTLVWTINNFATVTHDMVVRGGTVNYNRDELISFTVTFEKALPRVMVTIDSVTLPILSFNFIREYQVESVVKTLDVESIPVSQGFTIQVRIAHDGSTTSNAILQSIIDGDTSTTYDIEVGGTTHECTIQQASYQFEQTGALLYDVTFVKAVSYGI